MLPRTFDGGIVFASRHMKLAVETARRFAHTPSPVLIEGESGTGKELIARLIHAASPRRHKPFVAVNCGAIPETLFESEIFGYRAGAFTGAVKDKPGIFETADGGTLFLDEIGDLSMSMQAKCLRVLQERELRRVGDTVASRIDVRIISATNKDLEQQMRIKRFREDLYFRIGVLRVTLEPLRNRPEDTELLCRHLAGKYAQRLGKPAPEFSPDVMFLFKAYPWPGNVRELENEVHRLVALARDSRPLETRDISPRIRDGGGHKIGADDDGSLRVRLALCERQIIQETLEHYGWNKTKAAKYLGLTRQGLHRKLQKLRIRRDE